MRTKYRWYKSLERRGFECDVKGCHRKDTIFSDSEEYGGRVDKPKKEIDVISYLEKIERKFDELSDKYAMNGGL